MTTTDMGLTGAQLQLQECLLCLLEGLHSIPGLTVPSLLLVALLSPSKYPSPACNFRPMRLLPCLSLTVFPFLLEWLNPQPSPVHQEWQLHMGIRNSL